MDRFLIKKVNSDNSTQAGQSHSSKKQRTDIEICQKDSNEIETVVIANDSTNIRTSTSSGVQKTKRVQKFRSIWLEKFNWIIEKEDKPFCKLCNKILTNNINHIERHKNSNLHTAKISSLKNQPDILESNETIEFRSLLKSTKIAELVLIMFIIQHNLPFVLIDELITLIKCIASDSKIAKHLKLGKSKATYTVTSLLHTEGLQQISECLRNQPFSLIIDETTNVSTSKCLAIVVRYFDKILGKVRDRFLNLIELTNCDANSIYQTLITFFNHNKIPLHNLIGFAADNASVMMGKKNGVQKLLQNTNPSLYVLGCICHSIHLCSSAASKKLPKHIELLVRNIYIFFAHSAKRQTEFKEFQEMFDVKVHKILKTSCTRWLSLENVVNRVLEQWTALNHFFISYDFENNDLANTILSEMSDSNKLYLCFLSYILKLTNKINIEFQAEAPKIHLLLPIIEAYVKTILSNFVKAEYLISQMNEIDFSRKEIFLNLENVYLGGKAEMLIQSGALETSEVNAIKTKCVSYYIELCDQIFKRINFNDTKLIALKGLNPKCLANSIIPLYSCFPNIVVVNDVEQLDQEWRTLQNYSGVDNDLDLQEFWCSVFKSKNGLKEKMFPNLENFVSSLLSLPHSSATAERVFSQLNLIKDKKRNSLHTSTVNAIMVAKEMLGDLNAPNWIPSDNLIKCYNKFDNQHYT